MEWGANRRRLFLKQIGPAGALALTTANPEAMASQAQAATPADSARAATRAQRMAWWHQAKFGMFIHWGLYSVTGQHEWANEVEGVPIAQYELLAKHFHSRRQW
jgi:alpha-L-fucosidase